MEEEGVKDLLQRLSGNHADGAWREFLARYSPLLMQVVRRFEIGEMQATDCFVHVCGALSDDGFRRLRAFRSDGAARFDTWLKTVASNLCVDWRRKLRGRIRPLCAVNRLPELEQRAYQCLYMQGMDRTESLHILQARFPDLTEQRLSEINARLFSELTQRQRWQAGVRKASMVSLDAAASPDDESPEPYLVEPGPGPDGQAEADEERRLVEAAMQQLPSQQRLLIRMRFEQNLTLAEIARLTGQSDTNRVYRQLEAAIVALRKFVDP